MKDKAKTVEEMAKEAIGTRYSEGAIYDARDFVTGYTEGFPAGQAALLEQAAEGFEEWSNKHFGYVLTKLSKGTMTTAIIDAYNDATLAAEKKHQKERGDLLKDRDAWKAEAEKYINAHGVELVTLNKLHSEKEEMLKDLDDLTKEFPVCLSPKAAVEERQRYQRIRKKWFGKHKERGEG